MKIILSIIELKEEEFPRIGHKILGSEDEGGISVEPANVSKTYTKITSSEIYRQQLEVKSILPIIAAANGLKEKEDA